MVGDASEARSPAASRSRAVSAWAAVGIATALVVGSTTSLNPTAGIAAAVAIAAVASIVTQPATILFLLAASVLIEQVRIEGSTISRVLAPIALLAVVVQLIRGRATIRAGTCLAWTIAYSAWAVASGLWTTSTGGTVFLLSSLAIALIYMLSFASLLNTPLDLQRVLGVLVFASLLLGVLSFRQVSSAVHIGQLVQEGRSQGGTGDPNYFAAIQLVVLPLVLVLAREAKSRWLEFGLYAAALVNVASILTSLSRGGFIGLVVLVLMLVVLPARIFFRSRRSKALALTILAIGAVATAATSGATISARIDTLRGQGQTSASRGSGRLDLWKAAFHSVEQRPWLGLGYGAFPSTSRELLLDTPGVDLATQPPSLPDQPVHNTYLESLAELGILGPLLFVGLLVSTGSMLRRSAKAARDAGAPFLESVATALLLGLVTWAITSVFLSAETARTLWIIVGLSLALPKLVAGTQVTPATGDRSR